MSYEHLYSPRMVEEIKEEEKMEHHSSVLWYICNGGDFVMTGETI